MIPFHATSQSEQEYRTATLIEGDGIGPEIADAVKKVFAAAGAPINWETVVVSTAHVKPGEPLLSQEVIDSVNRNGIGLKGRSSPAPVLFSFPFLRHRPWYEIMGESADASGWGG